MKQILKLLFRLQLQLAVAVLLFPLEAFVSGMYPVPVIDDYVFVELSVGLKIQKEENDGAYKRNNELIAEAEKSAKLFAQKMKAELKKFKKKNPTVRLLPIEAKYGFYESSMSGYQMFPTLKTDQEIRSAQDKPGYVLLQSDPRVTVRFKKIPSLELIQSLKTAIKNIKPQ